MRSELRGISIAGLGLALACGRGETKGATYAETTSMRVLSNETAVQSITGARCDREVACNNIGQGRSYESRESCVRELAHDRRADLRAEECPHGVSSPDLDDCLTDIRNEKCGNPFDSLARLAACRTGKLCVKT